MSGIFSIDGNIGSGKSTAVALLKGKLGDNVIFVDEPVDIWNSIQNKEGETILKKFYERPHVWAFSFQMMAYISRLSVLKAYIKDFPTAILITERSTFTDYNVFAKMLYDNGDINEIEYQIYIKWFHEFIADIPIKGFIYITTEPKKCLERIHKRNRKGEVISLHYLEECHKYHKKWLREETNVLELDGNVEYNPTIINNWSDKILNFIEKICPKIKSAIEENYSTGIAAEGLPIF
jgi:deoxyadenosine/deoxycytidine kinase